VIFEPLTVGQRFLIYIDKIETDRRCTAWGVQRRRRRPQAALAAPAALKRPSGHFKSSPPAGHERAGHGGHRWKFRESMATPCDTPMKQSKYG
jgi:hypothetical protein